MDPLGLSGQVLDDKYAVDRAVGEGGFATVYRAMHLVLKRPVALKVFHAAAQFTDDERDKLVQGFVQEAAVLAELSERTAAICQARDVGTLATKRGDRLPYMVLEWLEGRTLEAVLDEEVAKNVPPRTMDQAVRWLEPIAEALALAHGRGIAHRDVKPSNVFILEGDKAGVIKLLDFGIAKVVQDSHKTFSRTAGTGGGMHSAFTPAYGTPEQFNRDVGTTGPWTDVFALALVMSEIVSGKPALTGDNVMQLMVSASNPEKRPTPRTLGARVSDSAEAVFRKALAVNPGDRYGSVGEMWSALQSATGVSRRSGFAEVSSFLSNRPPDLSLPDLELPPSKPTAKLQAESSASYGLIDFSWEDGAGPAVDVAPQHAIAVEAPISKPPPSQRPSGSGPLPSQRPSGLALSQPPSGIDLAVPSRAPPPVLERAPREEPFAVAIWAAEIAVAVIVTTGLVLGVHRARGWRLLETVPSTVDGSSVATSGVCALAMVVLCILSGSFGVLREARSWGLVVSAVGYLGMAIGFIVATVSAPQEPGGPPAEGGVVVAWAAPIVTLGLAFALVGVGVRRWKEDEARALALLLAALAGGCLFVSVELLSGAR